MANTSRRRHPHRSMVCPACHEPAEGDFCANCGARLVSARCPRCGTELEPGARFCHNCSHRVSRARQPTSAIPLLVIAVGVAVTLILFAAITSRRASRPLASGGAEVPPSGVLSPAPGVAPGTPRAQVDAQFDRAIRAFEMGDSVQATQLGRMALNAYSLFEPLDTDARFHVGLLHQITRSHDAMLAQADSIELTSPNHLFAILLRQRAHRLAGAAARSSEQYRHFLERYEDEIATGKVEYRPHLPLLESFNSEARRAVGR